MGGRFLCSAGAVRSKWSVVSVFRDNTDLFSGFPCEVKILIIFNLLCILQVMVSFIGNMKSRCRKGLFRNMDIFYPSLFSQDRVMSPIKTSLGFLFAQKIH